MRDFCSFLERRNGKFRENHAEVNSKANPPALSTAPLTLRQPPEPDSTTPGNRSLFAYSSRQHLSRASCTLLCACLVLEGSLQEAHSALLKEPGLAGKGGTQAHQGRGSCSTACWHVASVAGEESVVGRGYPLGSVPLQPAGASGQEVCVLATGLGLRWVGR